MLSRWFSAAIVLFWLSTMSWLFVAKVLPPLLVGEPPNYRTVLEELVAHASGPVRWRISLDGKRIGRAVTEVEQLEGGVSRLHNNLLLTSLPISDLGPLRFAALENIFQGPGGSFELEADSVFEIDPLGRLVVFETRLRLGSLKDAVHLRGLVEGNELQLRFSAGGIVRETTTFLAADALTGDGFSPQDRLPRLRIGQKWTVPVYSPFRPRTDPMEILEATVQREELIEWNGRLQRTKLVVYHRDQGAGLRDEAEPTAKMWVLDDGLVVRQEALLLGSWLQFLREPPRSKPAQSPEERHDVRSPSENRDAPR